MSAPMLATPPASAPPRGDAGSGVTPVVRLHLTNPWTTLLVPSLTLAGIFAINWLIWVTVLSAIPVGDRADASDGFRWNGAIFFVFIYMLVVGAQSMTGMFAYAMSLGATRRQFYLGSLLTFAGLSALYGLGFTVLAEIERATRGWGVGGAMFAGALFGSDAGPLARFWMYFVGLLLFFTIGAAVSTVYVRWRANGLTLFFILSALVLVGIAALVTLARGWAAVGLWLAQAGPVGIATALLGPTVVAAVAGYLILLRASPRD